MISLGADVNSRDESGNGAIHFASWGNTPCHRNSKAIETLLKLGADSSAVSRTTFQPLFCAVYLRDLNTIRTLVEYGWRAGDGAMEDRGGSRGKRTALCVAIENGDIETASLLVSLGVASIEDDSSEPPLNESRFSDSDHEGPQVYAKIRELSKAAGMNKKANNRG